VEAARFLCIVDGTPGLDDMPGSFVIATTPDAGVTPVNRLKVGADGNTVPTTDNAYSIGTSGARWSAVWAANGTIQTSDARDKIQVGDLSFAGGMIDTVDPLLFRWVTGGNDIVTAGEDVRVEPRSGVRTHAGFLAQDVKAAMDALGVDFGAWGREDKGDPDS